MNTGCICLARDEVILGIKYLKKVRIRAADLYKSAIMYLHFCNKFSPFELPGDQVGVLALMKNFSYR